MFDLIFNAMSAWNQVGLILMATVFLLIGGAILADFFYWRKKAKRVNGRITAIVVQHQKNNSDRESEPYIPPEQSESYSEGFKKKPVASSFGMVFLLLFLGIPFIFSGIGLWMGYGYYDLTHNGNFAEARVVRNDSSYDSESGTTYKAVVSFRDSRGKTWEVKDNISYGSSPSFKTGTVLGVYYDPDDPERFVIDDFWHNMGIAIAFFGFGAVFIGFGVLASVLNSRQNSPKKVYGRDGKKKKQSYAGEMYYPIFEYRSPMGEILHKKSDMGTNYFLNNLPGKRVKLLVMPDDPSRVRKVGYVGLIFGLIFFLPGLFIGNVALTQFEFNPFVILFILGGLGFLFYKLRGVWQSIPEADRKEGWSDFKSGKMFKDAKFSVSSSLNKGGEGNQLDDSEIRERIRPQQKYLKVSAVLCLLISGGLFIGSIYAGQDMIERVQNGVRAEGKVVDIESRYSSSSDSSGYTYYAVVEFKDSDGRNFRFRDSVGASHPLFKRDDRVTVLYMPDDPDDVIIDRNIYNWGLSGGLAFAALMLLWMSLHSVRVASSRHVSRFLGPGMSYAR